MKLVLASLEFLMQPYDYRGLKVFCKSLRSHYDGDCVFFVRNLPQPAIDILSQCKIQTINKGDYESQYKMIKFGINATRRVYYYLFLKNNPQYNDIISTDVTDVVFQSNPFLVQTTGIAQISEEAALIKDCKINAGWITGNYDDKTFQQIGNKPILCAGIIRANNQNTQAVSRMFFKEVQDLYIRSNGTKFGNLDQAHIEFIFHTQPFDKEILPYLNPSFVHIGHTVRNNIEISNADNSLCISGITPSMVHQYNRHKDVEEKLYELYN